MRPLNTQETQETQETQKTLKKAETDFIHNKEWIPEGVIISVKEITHKKELFLKE